MNRRLFVLAFVAQAIALLHAQSSKPDFTGVWQLNIAESKHGKDSPLTYYRSFTLAIKQSGDGIDIREDITSPSGVHRVSIFAFKTDGRSYNPTSGLPKTVISGKWKGDTLVEMFRDEGGEVVRKMRLSSDGKKIFADWQFTPSVGVPELATEVWDRQ